jgi:hypothetical protein
VASPRRLAGWFVAALVVAAASASAQDDPRLRKDLGGFTPTKELLDAAEKVGPRSKKTEDPAAPPTVPLDVLRAGLRLADDAAARRCAARLTHSQMDRWECARCVDLLVEDVLKPDTDASFEEFRSYVGSVELTRYLRSLPPLPWDLPPATAFGQMHRVERAEHIQEYLRLARHPDKDVADAAESEIGLLQKWNDEFREEICADDRTEAFLRRQAAEGVDAARRALIRRGDAKLLDEFAANLREQDQFALALLSARRRARIGVVVPGCRTRRLAEAAARRLAAADFAADDDDRPTLDRDGAAFLETAAPEAFRESLRKLAAGDDGLPAAREMLLEIGDPVSGARLAAWFPEDDRLARSPSPETRKSLEGRVRAAAAAGSSSRDDLGAATASLAVCAGLPEDAAGWGFADPPTSAVDALLAGRPIDWLATCLASRPDERHGNVGAVDDPRVRAYLVRLRERRDLGEYWYATGQLAAMGDPASRSDFWGAMQDGRYRVMDEAEEFERTLGWNLPETMPFWIDELRSQCCRITTSATGDIVKETLGLDCYESPWRIPHRRAKELWDAAGGRFVKSRIADLWVPAPR